MKRTLFFITGLLFSIGVLGQSGKSFHDFTVRTITGESFNLSQLKGKKVWL
jgi:hypothetical protein